MNDIKTAQPVGDNRIFIDGETIIDTILKTPIEAEGVTTRAIMADRFQLITVIRAMMRPST